MRVLRKRAASEDAPYTRRIFSYTRICVTGVNNSYKKHYIVTERTQRCDDQENWFRGRFTASIPKRNYTCL